MTKQEAKKTQEVKAFARHIHVGPRKLRLVADMIRSNPVDVALEQLKFSSKQAALPITKVLNSAIANAVHNFNLNKDELFVKSITIDGGPVMKRMFPRAQGRGFIVRKRTSHINVVLGSKPRSKKSTRSIFNRFGTKADQAKKSKQEIEEGKVTSEQAKPKTAPKSEEKIKTQTSTLKRRLFNRKSGE